MPTKTTKAGREYDVTGKKFIWHPLDDDGNTGNLSDVEIPMRLKLKVLRSMAGEDVDNVATMFRLLEQLVPNHADTLDEMDVNDFTQMFSTWQDEYNALNGATPGE